MDTQESDLTPSSPTVSRREETLWREIRRTRSDMDDVIDELQRRISPTRIAEETMTNIKEKTQELAREVGTTTTDFVKEHPLPLALLGAGAAWLVTEIIRENSASSSSSGQSRALAPRYGGATGVQTGYPTRLPSQYGSGVMGEEGDEDAESHRSLKDKTREVYEKGKHKASDAWHTVSEKTEHAYESAMHATKETAAKAGHYIEEGAEAVTDAYKTHPLLFVAGALGAGVALGLALPSTRREDQWMGEYRDRIFDRARELGCEALERGEDVAKETLRTAREETRAEAEEMKDSIASEASREKSRIESAPAATPGRPAGSTSAST